VADRQRGETGGCGSAGWFNGALGGKHRRMPLLWVLVILLLLFAVIGGIAISKFLFILLLLVLILALVAGRGRF
jgi:hypothetical protein